MYGRPAAAWNLFWKLTSLSARAVQSASSEQTNGYVSLGDSPRLPSSERSCHLFEEFHLKKPFSPSFSFDSRRFRLIDHIPSFRDQLVHGCAAPWWSFHLFRLFDSELSGRLSTPLGTLFEIQVPQCSLEHDGKQARRKDCIFWPCRVEAIFLDALDLYVKLRQRDHKTVFRWPVMNGEFDESFIQHEGESIPSQQSGLTVNITYMPAVINQRDSEDPEAIEDDVWYKAVVRLAKCD